MRMRLREGHRLSPRSSQAWCCSALSWALFLGAMLTGVVVTPSLSDQRLSRRSSRLRLAQWRLGRRRVPECSLCAVA